MKKLFISQPMKGLSNEKILKVRAETKAKAEKDIGEPLELLESYFDDFDLPDNTNIPVAYLGKSISLLAEADLAYFVRGWRNARGCKIENEVAKRYGINRIEEV